MTRPRRLVIPGVPLHIRQRRVDRTRCFIDEADHRLYLGLMGELSREHGIDIHAYALMPNHIHILATPPTATAPSRFMKALAQRFALNFNRKYRRCGHLWESRFNASLVDTTLYFFVCSRYIELNPVRAALVETPDRYPYTSYATNAFGMPSTLISPHREYVKLGCDAAMRLRAYREIVESGVSVSQLDAIRNAIENNLPFGSKEFIDKVKGPREGAAAQHEEHSVPLRGTECQTPV